jgi:serine protease
LTDLDPNPARGVSRGRRLLLLCLLLWMPTLWAEGRVMVLWAEDRDHAARSCAAGGSGRRDRPGTVLDARGGGALFPARMARGGGDGGGRGPGAPGGGSAHRGRAGGPAATLQFVPNDSRYADQWYLYDAAGINAPAAWDLQRGSASVVVAVLDTGILPHEDIDELRVLPGYDFFSDVTRDNDGESGRDSDPTDPGDAVAADECGAGEPAENSSWHGLIASGILMATADNALGVAGVDHRVRLLPVRVSGKCGAWSSDIFEAMRWAAGLPETGVPSNPTPAHVINLSLAYDRPCGDFEQSIINEVIARGAVVVAAAGNEAIDVANVSPASCNGVITVAASDQAGARASFTNVGAAVDITAPGVSILTTYNLGTTDPAADWYAFVSGTSFSTPQVAGVLALMRADRPDATVDQLRQALLAGAKPFPDSSCNTSLCGAGLLDAEGAILALRGLPASTGGGGGGGGCVQAADGRPEGLWWLGLAWVLYRFARRNDYAGRQV